MTEVEKSVQGIPEGAEVLPLPTDDPPLPVEIVSSEAPKKNLNHDPHHVKKLIREAFEELRTKFDIYCRMNFRCCQNCASTEIRDKLEKDVSFLNYIGFCFYHQQDAESFDVDGTGYLAFGHRNCTDEGALEIGKTITAVLREHGLSIEWEEDPSTRIYVEGAVL